MKNKIISLILSLTILKPCGANNNLNEVKTSIINNCKYTCETSLDTDENLNNYIINWSKQVYGIDITKEEKIDIKYDDLNSLFVNGLFSKDKKILVINENIKNNKEVLERTIIHESTHLCLYLLNKPFKDEDIYFQKECFNNGGIANDTGENKSFYSYLEGNKYYDTYKDNIKNYNYDLGLKRDIIK